MRREAGVAASAQDGTYPRPQLVRADWVSLDGPWEFDFDPEDAGLEQGWAAAHPLPRTITVPFPPESPASGIGDAGYHRVLWYRRVVTAREVEQAGHDAARTLLVHFGAVDYRADVWVDGAHLARHEGGHTPFSVRVPEPGAGFEIVVRVEDDPHDLAQPRGKQDWDEQRHVVWYDRTSGIWQPVWLESVPRTHLEHLLWIPDVSRGEVGLSIELSERPLAGSTLRVTIRQGRQLLAEQTISVSEPRARAVIVIDALRNGQALDGLLWSPEHPTLIDATLELQVPGQASDLVASYFGFRHVAEADGHFLLNDRPYEIRGVLSQGYWPQSHLAAPDPGALRAEVELIRELGFTTVRVHQKIEDPRFLYWTDRLGLLVWEEMPSVYEFSPTASARLVAEWTEVIRRDSSHPSIAVWVPFNESWGVQQVATDAAQQSLVRGVYHLTKALDATRLVISNDGWEHVVSDLLTVHDYENDAAKLLGSYGTEDTVRASLAGVAPSGRRTFVGTPEEESTTAARPRVLSEFGGVSIDPSDQGSWGYRLLESHEQLDQHLVELFAAARGTHFAGWCYTQLTDTAQETNGLADEQRVPKLPAERIRSLVRGEAHESVRADQR